MAKTESTAVNDLIKLVETQTPLKADPSDDLMFKAPAQRPSKVSPPRFTQTIPNMKGAGEVAPLPRQRSGQGTQRGVPALGSRPPAPNNVRVSTAPAMPPMPSLPTIPPARPSIADRPTRPSAATTPFAAAEGTGSAPAIPAAARTTKPSLPPPTRPSGPRVTGGMRTEAPAAMPVVAPFSAPPAPPVVAPSAFPAGALAYPPAAHLTNDMTSNQAWFDDAQFRSAPVEVEIPIEVSGTARVPRNDWKHLIPKLIVPTLGLVILGVFVGGFFAFDGEGRKHAEISDKQVAATERAMPAPAAKTEPAAAKTEPVATKTEPAATEPVAAKTEQAKTEPVKTEPVKAEPVKAEPVKAEPVKTEPVKAEPVKAEPAHAIATPPVIAPAIAGRHALIDIRIDSKPAGATVTLVDRGKPMYLGTTPIATAVDPSRTYDLLLSYNNRAPQLEHFDPKTTQRLSITLGGKKSQELPKIEAPKKTETTKVEAPKKEAPKAIAKIEAPKAEAPKAEKKAEAPKAEKKVVDPFDGKPTPEVAKPEPKPPAAPTGEGTLMVSSKPPCEIWVDGAATGLSTPQRAIKLTAGKHKITLVNIAEKIKKMIPVTVTADQPTKVIENFMK